MRLHFTFAIFTLLLSAIPAQAELKIKHFAITKGRVAFSYNELGSVDIYVLDFQKLLVTPFVKTKGKDEYPSWSPDGTKLAFVSDESGNKEIYTVNADGTNLKKIAPSPAADMEPHWSPDGTQIVFSSGRLGRGQNLFVTSSNGHDTLALSKSSKKLSVPKWSPKGTEILYTTNTNWPGWDIGLFDLGTKKGKVLTHGYRSFCAASWHPNGSSYAFAHGSAGDIDIWLQKKGEPSEKITDLPGREYDPEWAEEGRSILFVHEKTKGEGNYQLYLLDVETKTTNQVTSGPGAVRNPSWTPLPSLESILPERTDDFDTETTATDGDGTDAEAEAQKPLLPITTLADAVVPQKVERVIETEQAQKPSETGTTP